MIVSKADPKGCREWIRSSLANSNGAVGALALDMRDKLIELLLAVAKRSASFIIS
jgi:hypothetical protein